MGLNHWARGQSSSWSDRWLLVAPGKSVLLLTVIVCRWRVRLLVCTYLMRDTGA